MRDEIETDLLFILNDVQSFFPAMTKIVGTLGPKSRSVEVISGCLKAGMSGKFYLIVCFDDFGICFVSYLV